MLYLIDFSRRLAPLKNTTNRLGKLNFAVQKQLLVLGPINDIRYLNYLQKMRSLKISEKIQLNNKNHVNKLCLV